MNIQFLKLHNIVVQSPWQVDGCRAEGFLALFCRDLPVHTFGLKGTCPMATKDLLDRLANLPERTANMPTVPPIELVAFVVRWNRDLRQWKTTTLAEFARVSVSTVERVERGDRVSGDALDRIAQAFGYDPGYFTAPRIPLPRDEAAASMVEQFSNLEVVSVAAMKTHRAVREAARCQAYLIHRPGVPDTYNADIEALQEWLDLGSFILSDIVHRGPAEESGRRELYDRILGSVAELERRGLTVLSEVMAAPQEGLPDWKAAVISITPRSADPGAVKRRHIMVDRRVTALPKRVTAK